MTTTRETKSVLARRLKIHRSQLDTFLARPGAPSPDRKKRYGVQAVAEFVASQRESSTLDTLRAARLREVQLRCESLSRQLAKDDKAVITIAEMDRILGHVSQTLRLVIISELENNLPPRLDGMAAAQMRPLMRDSIDTVFDTMHDCLSQFEITRGFRQSLEAAAS